MQSGVQNVGLVVRLMIRLAGGWKPSVELFPGLLPLKIIASCFVKFEKQNSNTYAGYVFVTCSMIVEMAHLREHTQVSFAIPSDSLARGSKVADTVTAPFNSYPPLDRRKRVLHASAK